MKEHFLLQGSLRSETVLKGVRIIVRRISTTVPLVYVIE